jgi:hypothetical protein
LSCSPILPCFPICRSHLPCHAMLSLSLRAPLCHSVGRAVFARVGEVRPRGSARRCKGFNATNPAIPCKAEPRRPSSSEGQLPLGNSSVPTCGAKHPHEGPRRPAPPFKCARAGACSIRSQATLACPPIPYTSAIYLSAASLSMQRSSCDLQLLLLRLAHLASGIYFPISRSLYQRLERR